jgi:hypothetical protein
MGYSTEPRSWIRWITSIVSEVPNLGKAIGSTRKEKLLVGNVANVFAGVPRRNDVRTLPSPHRDALVRAHTRNISAR